MKNQENTVMCVALDEVKTTATKIIAKWVTIGVLSIAVLFGAYMGVNHIIDKKTEEAKQVLIAKKEATKKKAKEVLTIAQANIDLATAKAKKAKAELDNHKQAIINKYTAIANNDLLKAEAEVARVQAEAITQVNPIETMTDEEIRDNGATLQQKYNTVKLALSEKIKAIPMPKLVWSKEVNTTN